MRDPSARFACFGMTTSQVPIRCVSLCRQAATGMAVNSAPALTLPRLSAGAGLLLSVGRGTGFQPPDDLVPLEVLDDRVPGLHFVRFATRFGALQQ
jgi:hypothetical protein